MRTAGHKQQLHKKIDANLFLLGLLLLTNHLLLLTSNFLLCAWYRVLYLLSHLALKTSWFMSKDTKTWGGQRTLKPKVTPNRQWHSYSLTRCLTPKLVVYSLRPLSVSSGILLLVFLIRLRNRVGGGGSGERYKIGIQGDPQNV